MNNETRTTALRIMMCFVKYHNITKKRSEITFHPNLFHRVRRECVP